MPRVEERVLERYAALHVSRISARVIRQLQRLREGHTMLSHEFGLKSIWDEICYQAQTDKSIYWELYLQALETSIQAELHKCSELELETLWLNTAEGEEWLWRVQGDTASAATHDIPWNPDDVAQQLRHRVLSQAGSWSNPRIRRVLELRV